MRKLTEAEEFLLRNWSDVEKLQATVADLNARLVSDVETALTKRTWWARNQFAAKPYVGKSGGALYVYKSNWLRGKWSWNTMEVSLVADGLDPGTLLGLEEYPLLFYVRVTKLAGSSSQFNQAFKKLSGYTPRKWASLGLEDFESDDDEYPIYFEANRSREQWATSLKTGRYAEEICRYFDKLVQFISPIDRVLAELRGSAARKKR